AKTDVVRFCFLLGTRRSRHHRISLKAKSLRKSDVLSDVFSGPMSPPFPRPPPLKENHIPEYNVPMMFERLEGATLKIANPHPRAHSPTPQTRARALWTRRHAHLLSRNIYE